MAAAMLEGIKVVEFAQNLAIPACGRILAAMGADVVKVEPPGGDAMRATAGLGPKESRAFAQINPGKRGMVIDLRSSKASPVVDALFRWADVALVAFKGSDLVRYGLDWDHARLVNPRLIHLTHTPFGPRGDDAEVGGYDALVQAVSGMGFLMNRTENGTPVATRPAVNDAGTGIASVAGVIAALRHRDHTGEGQRVDTSLLGTAMSLSLGTHGFFEMTDVERTVELDVQMAAAREAGEGFDGQRAVYEAQQHGQANFRLYFRHYLTKDSLISVAGLTNSLQQRFHAVTGIKRPENPRDHTSQEFQATVDQAERLFLTKTTTEWMAELRAAGYPCARYNTPTEALRDPQVVANDFVAEIDNPIFGKYLTVGIPMQFSATPALVEGPSPGFGEHTREVLAEIGFDGAGVEYLVTSGVTPDGSQTK